MTSWGVPGVESSPLEAHVNGEGVPCRTEFVCVAVESGSQEAASGEFALSG